MCTWCMIGGRGTASPQPNTALPRGLIAALDNHCGDDVLQEIRKLLGSPNEVLASALYECALSDYFMYDDSSLQVANDIAKSIQDKLGIEAIRRGAKNYICYNLASAVEIGDDFNLDQVRDAVLDKGTGCYCFLCALTEAVGLTG